MGKKGKGNAKKAPVKNDGGNNEGEDDLPFNVDEAVAYATRLVSGANYCRDTLPQNFIFALQHCAKTNPFVEKLFNFWAQSSQETALQIPTLFFVKEYARDVKLSERQEETIAKYSSHLPKTEPYTHPDLAEALRKQ